MSLPRNLAALAQPPRDQLHDTNRKPRWFTWALSNDKGPAFAGKVQVVVANDRDATDAAMVRVRDAAVADDVQRPFEITISRVFRVADETVQKTAEVTS